MWLAIVRASRLVAIQKFLIKPAPKRGPKWNYFSKAKKLVLKFFCGFQVKARNKRGQTALHLAAFNGLSAFTKTLVEHGANMDIPDGDFYTAMNYCVMPVLESIHSKTPYVRKEHFKVSF